MLLRSLLTLKQIRANLGLSTAELRGLQLRKLRALLRHAYENVPYYRRLFDEADLRPQQIESTGDLQRLPITDKERLRALNHEQTCAGNIAERDRVRVFTSGSTGMPASIYYTRRDYALIDLFYLRSFVLYGLKLRHRRAFVLDPHSFDTSRRWYHRLGLAKTAHVSCFLDTGEQLRLLEEAEPHFIQGYPSSLAQIARLMLRKAERGLRPQIVTTAAELLRAQDREQIRTAFQADVLDCYAARECGLIAWECARHSGYHINIDAAVVEFIRDGRPVEAGERGQIVVTNLHSYAMPFIRYRLGDLGIPAGESCGCGCPLPLMEIIEGRDEDFIVLPDGRRVSPMAVTGTLDFIPGLKQYRVIQERRGHVIALLSRGPGFSSASLHRAEQALKGLLGSELPVTCRVLEEIPRERSGKVRAVISRYGS